MSKRIILFGPLPPPYGGVAIYLKSLVAHFRDADVRVWTYGGTKPKGAKGAKGRRVRFVAHRRLGTVWALLAEGRGARILDASHFHLEYPNPLLLPLWLELKRRLGFEWFKNILDGSLPKRYPRFSARQRRLFEQAIKAVDEFVVVSEELARWLREEIKVRQPITVIPCLLPTPPDESATPLSTETRELLGPWLSRARRVCSIGVFYPSYGFKDVAEAVAELRERTGQDIGLVLLDGAFVSDARYREEVLADRGWITVLREVPNPETYEILKRSDVFVRAFADESYGISRVEALWCGVPVIATRAGETRGMLLYDFGDVEQLTKQLQAALLNPASQKMSSWAERYRREAEANLRAVAGVLGIDERGKRGKG